MSYGVTVAAGRAGGVADLQRAVADVEEARLAADRQRPAPHDLHPRVLLRVVRGGDLDAAVELELADREIDHLGARRARGRAPPRPRRRPRGSPRRPCRAREAHVAPDGDAPRLELLDVCPPDRVCAVLVQLAGIDAADVVCLEHLRVEHRADAMENRPVARLLTTTMRSWSGSSRPSCSSISSPPRSFCRARTRRSSVAASRSSSSRSRTASSRTAASSRSSRATR